jgi:hypothetical protein
MAPEPLFTWTAPAVNYVTTADQKNGQVKVSVLNWKCKYEEDEYVVSSYGNTPDDQNRVYTKPALESVPEHAVVKWVKDALGSEEVARIEQDLVDKIEAKRMKPMYGTYTKQRATTLLP